jgi:hypothetical protein
MSNSQIQFITDSKLINLSSNSATNVNGSYNSVMVFDLNNIVKKDKTILYTQVSVVHAEIPISYYIVNSSNNFLSSSVGDYNLINGNYNASTFKAMLLALLPIGFTLSLNSNSGIFTMAYTTDFTINSTSTCYKFLGFAKSTSYSSSSYSLTFPYPCNFLGISRIKIKSATLATRNLDSYNKANLLASIPVNSAPYGLLIYENKSNFKNILLNESVDSIDITITDEVDNIINFNGIDVYITIQIDSIRENIIFDPNLNNVVSSEFKGQ